MKRRTPKRSKLMIALLGLTLAGFAQGATIRYNGSGDYFDLESTSIGGNGWQSLTVPGSLDTIRVNWGNNIVTLSGEAPAVARFQFGVDESGTLIVESGGKLSATGTSANRVGNNNPTGGSGVVGRLTVKTNGEVNSLAVLEVGAATATGVLTIDGGTVNQSHHLWVGSGNGSAGTIYITNGGVLNMLGVGGNGMLGLGTINASSASGGTGILKVGDGGVLNLFNISGTALGSIQPGSVLDISGSGVVTIPGDRVAAMSAYTNAGRITAYDGTGTVLIDYNTINPGKTTLTATGGYTPPTEVVWNPAANPTGNGLWDENANWTGGLRPASVTKVIFNVAGAIPCTISNAAVASQLVMGDNGPGGTLIITNGGSLACGGDIFSAIGYNNSATLVVENGGSANFANQLWIGLDPGSDGNLIMNGGTVSVANMFGLGWQGGKGKAQIKGGTLNLAQWDDIYSIQGESVIDVTGTGRVVINGDHTYPLSGYINSGQITNSSGAGLKVDYNVITIGKTTIYPADLELPPAQAVWNPALNFPDVNGLWNVSTNWSVGMVPGNVTVVTFNVLDAIPCTVTNAAFARHIVMGNGDGPGGTLIITSGGSLTTGTDNWSGVGYSSNALMIVENGASVNFGYHLWVGFSATSDATFVMNGGTVTVNGMFGLGWDGGKGTAQINGGTLILKQLHPTDSIKGQSTLVLDGTATVVITGDQMTPVRNYIASGKIKAKDGSNLAFSFDSIANATTIQIAPPQQSVTKVSFSSGNTTLTYGSTPGHIYHIESTPSLSPLTWTRVAGSTTNATGTAVSFTFPASGDQMFYRTVSP